MRGEREGMVGIEGSDRGREGMVSIEGSEGGRRGW